MLCTTRGEIVNLIVSFPLVRISTLINFGCWTERSVESHQNFGSIQSAFLPLCMGAGQGGGRHQHDTLRVGDVVKAMDGHTGSANSM